MWRLSSDVMLVMREDGTINASNPAWRALLEDNEVPASSNTESDGFIPLMNAITA